MNKKVVGVIIGVVSLFALPFALTGLLSESANAKSTSSLFLTNVSSMLSQSIESCGTANPNTAALTNSGAPNGNHFSSCYILVRNSTNAPGYNLMIQAIDGVQRSTVDGSSKWVYDVNGDGAVNGLDNYAIPYGDGAADGNTKLMQVIAENTPPTLPTLGTNYISPTSGTITSPVEMNASISPFQSAWGFAVPSTQTGTATTGFDSNYSAFNSSGGASHGKYAYVPTSASSIRITSAQAIDESTPVFFGTSISPNQPSGVYKGIVVFTVTANPIIEPAPIVVTSYPTEGLPAGGTTVDIYGAYFVSGSTTVTIGGSACASVVVASSSHLTCILPAKAAGSYAIVVTTPFGQSNNNVMYKYTTTPVVPDPNPYEAPNGVAGQRSFGSTHFSSGESTMEGSAVESGVIEPQGRSVFENLAESVGNENYNSLWIALAGGILLAGLIILLAILLGRKWDIYILADLKDNRPEVVKILVEKVGLDAKVVVASLQTIPSLAVEKVGKRDAKKIIKLLEGVKAETEFVRHGRKPSDNDSK